LPNPTEEGNVKRIAVALAAVAVAIVAAQAAPASSGSIAKVERAAAGKKPVSLGFFQGRKIRYFDFGPIKLKPGNRLAPIWTVTNGVAGQSNIVDTVPGMADYSPLWQVSEVTWKDDVTARLLTSAAAVEDAEQGGDVTIRKTATVVNCPVLGFGQKRIAGFSAGRVIHYYDLGPVKVAPGNQVVPLYAPTNGVEGQHNIAGEGIVKVTWNPHAMKHLLTSYAAVKREAAAGELTLTRTKLVVNCPLVP
jgi:hypothetical protein